MTFRVWVGLWQAFILLTLVAADVSTYVRYITRFTEESFSCLVSLIFVYEAITKVFFGTNTKKPAGAPTSATAAAFAYSHSPDAAAFYYHTDTSTATGPPNSPAARATTSSAGLLPLQAYLSADRSESSVSVSRPLMALLSNESRANLMCSCGPANVSRLVGLNSTSYQFDCAHTYGTRPDCLFFSNKHDVTMYIPVFPIILDLQTVRWSKQQQQLLSFRRSAMSSTSRFCSSSALTSSRAS